jgi:phosphoribosylamine---glycine ligase
MGMDMTLNVMLIGSGGREHALAWAMSRSPLLKTLYCAPGNPGIAKLATCLPIDVMDNSAVVDACRKHDVDFVVVGPEAPLVNGLVDTLAAAGIKAFGPDRFASQLEGSKGFTKDLCAQNAVPTAAYRRCKTEAEAMAFLQAHGAPIVVKADGLAAGKGVTVAMTEAEATHAIKAIFEGRFGEGECVIEEFLEGEEASFFVLSDGTNILPLATAQDHKRVGEGDIGPNTGGMGAYSPAPVMTAALCEQTLESIIKPTIKAMARFGHPFKGVLFAGIMITADGPKLIEYNVRFGDPETQALMPRLKSDILSLFLATADGTLSAASAEWRTEPCLAVVLAAAGYPGEFKKYTAIKGLDQDFGADVEVFHAGTAEKNGTVVSTGGRVLGVTALGISIRQAQTRAYEAVDKIDFPDGFCRRDIGWRALQ